MPTFLNATTDLMDMVGRPMSETTVLTAAKRELNQAIRQLQREQAFRYTERLFTFTYPAATLTVNFDSICDGSLRDLSSLQYISDATKTEGLLLEIKTYPWLQSERLRYQKGSRPLGSDPGLTLSQAYNFATAITRNNAYIAALVGNGITLYPTPQTPIILLCNAHIWLPVLSADSDTNFLLDYGYDVVLSIALRKMQIYLKTDSRYMVTETEVQAGVKTLLAWDGQVQMTPFTDPR